MEDRIKNLFRSRFQEAQQERNVILAWYLKARAHFLPREINLNGVDSTGLAYATKLANKLSAMILNSNHIWAWIETPRFEDISRDDKIIFRHITEIVFDEIQENSNFETEKAVILMDYLIGTAVFKVRFTGKIANPVEFQPVPNINVYLTKRRGKQPGDTFYNAGKVRKHQILNLFGEKAYNSEKVQRMSQDDEIELWEGTIYDQETKKFHYVVSTSNEFEDILDYRIDNYNPWIVARYESIGDSPYGIGPCVKAIMEIEGLKEVKANIRRIAKKQARPSYLGYGQAKYIQNSRIDEPGAISMMGQSPGQNQIIPFNRGENANMEFFNLDMYKELLRDIFYINIFETAQNLDQLKNVTATTTQLVTTEFAKQIEPTYALMQRELLREIVIKVFQCLQKISIIDISKIKALQENPRLKIRFYNALTIAQDQDDLERNMLYFQNIASTLGPQVAAANMNQAEYINAQQKRFRINNKEWKSGEETEKQVEEMNVMIAAQQQGGMIGQ